MIERFIRRLERSAADERIHRILAAGRVRWQRTSEILRDRLSDERRQGHAAARRPQRKVSICVRRQPDVGSRIPRHGGTIVSMNAVADEYDDQA